MPYNIGLRNVTEYCQPPAIYTFITRRIAQNWVGLSPKKIR